MGDLTVLSISDRTYNLARNGLIASSKLELNAEISMINSGFVDLKAQKATINGYLLAIQPSSDGASYTSVPVSVSSSEINNLVLKAQSMNMEQYKIPIKYRLFVPRNSGFKSMAQSPELEKTLDLVAHQIEGSPALQAKLTPAQFVQWKFHSQLSYKKCSYQTLDKMPLIIDPAALVYTTYMQIEVKVKVNDLLAYMGVFPEYKLFLKIECRR